MDPHSRRSQFNKRQRKVGPVLPPTRSMELPQAKPGIPIEHPMKRPRTSSESAMSLTMTRPIATNSRVKQDEQYRKDMHLAFINNALREKANGNSEQFDELVDQFNLKKPAASDPDAPSPVPQLRLWILALSHVVSRLDRMHSALVEAIINVPWATMDSAFVKSYTVFLGMLVSARPEYLSLVLGRIAAGFTHKSGLQALDSGLPESSSTPLTRRTVYERLHYLLRHLLSLIPTLPSTLQPLLSNNFPHKRQSQVAQVTYIRNLLQIMEYCPELADRILATIIDRALQIDVEIQVELEELEELEEEEGSSEVFELDPFDSVIGEGDDSSESEEDDDGDDNFSDISSDAGEAEDSLDPADATTDVHHVQDMVNKLDAILKLIFDHFNRAHAAELTIPLSSPGSSMSLPVEPSRSASPINTEEGRALRRAQFHTLLSIFDRSIIRTFKSRYTQFLIFWYSSLDSEFSDIFQGMLVSKALLEEDQPVVTRAAAASYIASFVSRARFVDREATRRVMGVLCNFLKNHLDIFDAVTLRMGSTVSHAQTTAHHSVFYAVSQAVFLIFCFRWRDLLEEQGEDDIDEMGSVGQSGPAKKWMTELRVLQRVVTSSLNPLKMCSSNVVMQFARVAQATDFIYCYSILEANKRSDHGYGYGPASGSGSTAARSSVIHPVILNGSVNVELNTFFPFDPYRLPKSSPYIEGVYREWSSVAIDDEDEEDEEEEEEVEDDSHAIDFSSPRQSQSDEDTDVLGLSFGGMSISPAPGALNVAMAMS